MEYIRRLDSTEVLRQRRLGNTDVGPHEDERLRVYCEQNSVCSENLVDGKGVTIAIFFIGGR